MDLCQSLVIVVHPVGELSDLAVVLVVSPDLLHHGVRGVLREDDGLGHVVIVILSENQNESELFCVIPSEPKILHLVYLIKDQFIPFSLFDPICETVWSVKKSKIKILSSF